MRETYTGLLEASWYCETCHGDEKIRYTRNALAVAARHHDATGHVVRVQEVRTVRYGGGQRGSRRDG